MTRMPSRAWPIWILLSAFSDSAPRNRPYLAATREDGIITPEGGAGKPGPRCRDQVLRAEEGTKNVSRYPALRCGRDIPAAAVQNSPTRPFRVQCGEPPGRAGILRRFARLQGVRHLGFFAGPLVPEGRRSGRSARLFYALWDGPPRLCAVPKARDGPS